MYLTQLYINKHNLPKLLFFQKYSSINIGSCDYTQNLTLARFLALVTTMVTKVDHSYHRSNDRSNHPGYYDGYYNRY